MEGAFDRVVEGPLSPTDAAAFNREPGSEMGRSGRRHSRQVEAHQAHLTSLLHYAALRQAKGIPIGGPNAKDLSPADIEKIRKECQQACPVVLDEVKLVD